MEYNGICMYISISGAYGEHRSYARNNISCAFDSTEVSMEHEK